MIPSRFAAKAASLSLAVLCAVGVASSAQAAPVSHTGAFTNDNDLVIFAPLNITSVTGGSISARTFSHSGGTNAAGDISASGGFAPVLALFDSTGFEVFRNIGSFNSPTPGCGVFCWDAFLSITVNAPGSFTLVLSQDDNLPDNFDPVIQNRYTQAGNASYFGGFNSPYEGQRTANWALDIDVINNPLAPAAVPEPAGVALVAAAMGALVLTRRRRGA